MLLKTVPQGHCLIVERFGKPTRVVSSGLHFFIPFLDVAKDVATTWGGTTNKQGIYIELTEQISDTPPRQYFTKDNVAVTVNCVYRWRITEPLKAVYEVDNLHSSLRETVLNEIRSAVGSRDLNDILASRAQLAEEIVAGAMEAVRRWGINLVSAEIQDIGVDEETRTAMRMQLEASRTSVAMKLKAEGEAEAITRAAEAGRQAAILKAEGEAEALKRQAEAEREAMVLRAQGEKEVMELRAQGERVYITMLAETLGPEQAAKLALSQKWLEGYDRIAQDPASKIYMPPPTSSASMVMLENTPAEAVRKS